MLGIQMGQEISESRMMGWAKKYVEWDTQMGQIILWWLSQSIWAQKYVRWDTQLSPVITPDAAYPNGPRNIWIQNDGMAKEICCKKYVKWDTQMGQIIFLWLSQSIWAQQYVRWDTQLSPVIIALPRISDPEICCVRCSHRPSNNTLAK